MMEEMDFRLRKAYFDALCEEVLRTPQSDGEGGIGTLGEKRMHALIKRFVCPNVEFHEARLEGTRYVADIRVGNAITEVQTGSFYPMKQKLAYYMESTDCKVTLLHPIAALKWINWIDPVTLEISKPTRSPLRGSVIHLLPELYPLLPLLGNGRLEFRVLLLEVQEFRWRNGWARDGKRGSARYEKLPVSLMEDVTLCSREDFAALLPPTLGDAPFTVKAFSSATKLRGRDAYSAVYVLEALGILERTEPIGRSMAFRRT